MSKARIISADSHVVEPGDLWTSGLPAEFKSRAPHVTPREDGGGLLFVPTGAAPFPVAAVFGLGRNGDELRDHMTKGYEMARPSGWDPAERLKDQDIDGVAAEVLYPSLGLSLYRMPDVELQIACFKVYNDWIANYCAHNPSRLLGAGILCIWDIPGAVAEMHRCKALGLRTVMIPATPPDDLPYTEDYYEPLWQAAVELQLPLSMHIGTNSGTGGKVRDSAFTDAMNPKAKSKISQPQNYATTPQEMQKTLASLVIGGVLDRHPTLRVVLVEGDSGWMPHLMYRLDHGYEKYRSIQNTVLSRKPSEIVASQVWTTFQDDPIGPIASNLYGNGNYMWASDFPHTETTWPHSLDVVDKSFEGVDEKTKHRVTWGNVVSLYEMNLVEAYELND
jgi:predicted TIM-barrel fold metal-dependent hydrolase